LGVSLNCNGSRLAPTHSTIFEVGCGIGTVSHLLAHQVKKGEVLAEIFPEIFRSKEILERSVRTIEVSIVYFDKPIKKLDFFVFPDVLEHNTSGSTFKRFSQNIQSILTQESVVIIHIPAAHRY